jgi:HemY protein
MRRLIWILIVLFISVWIGLKIADDPGLALFAWRQWSVEMPLWFAIVCLMVFMFLFYLLLQFYNAIGATWHTVDNWLRWRRKNKSYKKTNRGLIDLLEGQWKRAEKNLAKGLIQSDAPLINYLAAAKAAHEQGAYNRRDEYLQNAYKAAPHENIAIALTQAQFQLEQGQIEQALATLNQLGTINSKQIVVLKLLERIYVHLSDWKNLLKLLPVLRKAKIANHEHLDKLELTIYEELLKSAANESDNKDIIDDIWRTIPRHLQKHPRLVYCYVTYLFHYKESAVEIEKLIYKTLKSQWDPDLARLYGILETPDPKKQLSRAEKLLSLYNKQPVILLTLGRLCVRCQLWGKARHYLEDSIALEAAPETYDEYGKLLEQMNDLNAAMTAYRSGMHKTVI